MSCLEDMVYTCVHSSYMESVWRMYECSEMCMYPSYLGQYMHYVCVLPEGCT